MHILPMIAVVALIIAFTGISDEVDKGYDAAMSGELDTAVYHYTKALESDGLSRSTKAVALNNRGVVYQKMGRYRAALADFEAALVLVPGDGDVQRNRTVAAGRAGLDLSSRSGRASLIPLQEGLRSGAKVSERRSILQVL